MSNADNTNVLLWKHLSVGQSGLFFAVVQWCITEECVLWSQLGYPWHFCGILPSGCDGPQYGRSCPICMVSGGPSTISVCSDLRMRILTTRCKLHTECGIKPPKASQCSLACWLSLDVMNYRNSKNTNSGLPVTPTKYNKSSHKKTIIIRPN